MRASSRASTVRRLLFPNKLSSAGSILVMVFVVLAVSYWATGGAIAPYNPSTPNLGASNLPPNLVHPFGTDFLGRDIFSRVLAALPTDLSIAIFVVILSALIGIVLGTVAGYVGGLVEEVIMRLSDLFLAFPGLIMALAVAATLGSSLLNAAISLTFVWWPSYVRLVRGGVLAIKAEDFVAASKALNSSFPYILRKGIFPNVLPSILVYASLDVGTALLSLSALGYLGVGIPAGAPELGNMVSSIGYNLFTYPWEALLPSFVVLLIVAGFSLFGDGIREAGDVKIQSHTVIKRRLLGDRVGSQTEAAP
ncbi:MAG: ABC transporter permease [Thaumarchaeota archaeon]|nr:ABC transporter permease [Nitrososphaerota archaeon]